MKSIKSQVQWLLLVLMLVTLFNAGLLWKTLLENSSPKSAWMLTSIVASYLFVFGLVVLVVSGYLHRHLFIPLKVLSEKMKNFQTGKHQLPPQNMAPNEVGHLEAQFYDMAARIREQVDELKELDRVKTDFIAIASHELRTPMTSVKGSLSLILSGVVGEMSPDIKEVLSIAEKETDRLIRLINDILDLTKMEAKKLPLELDWYPLNDVLKTAVKSMKGLLEVTKVSVDLKFPESGWKVMIDFDRIHQVINNLLSNAIKFSTPGSSVTITYEPHESGLLIAVTDQGTGIKPEDQEYVFEKFRSMNMNKSKVIQGTGLGLPICKALIEQHGGFIGLKSTHGQGSTFYFTLPKALPLQPPQEKEHELKAIA